MCGVQARHQTAALEDPQFDWCVSASCDDIMECIFLSHGIVMSPLVLEHSIDNKKTQFKERRGYKRDDVNI